MFLRNSKTANNIHLRMYWWCNGPLWLCWRCRWWEKNCISFRFRFQNPHRTSSAMHLRVYVRCTAAERERLQRGQETVGIFVDKVYLCVPIALSDCARRKIENKFHSLQYAGEVCLSICLAHIGVTTLFERRSSSNVACRWPCTPTENSKQKREETNGDMNPTKDKNCSPRSRTERFSSNIYS